MEDTAQREIDLHKKVGESLGVSPEQLNPDDHSALHKIKDVLGNTAQVVGSYTEEFLAGKGPQTDVRVNPGGGWVHRVWERFRSRRKTK